MKNCLFKYFLILTLLDIGLSFCLSKTLDSVTDNNTSKLDNLLPDSTETNGWNTQGEAEIAIGQDLYLVINGGAEIYHEYGFRKAIFQTYIKKGHSINLEIYEMESNAAAFGIYSFKTGKDGLSLELGYKGWLETYFLNFWKGNYLVTITSMVTDTSCIEDLIKIAKAIDRKIVTESILPSLVSYLPKDHLLENGITYLKGNLALFNQNIFGPQNIFGINEGVIGEYHNHLIMIIKYQDNAEAINWYKSSVNYFQNSKNYNNFANQNTQFEITDYKDNIYWIKLFNNYIMIIRDQEIINATMLFNKIESKLVQ